MTTLLRDLTPEPGPARRMVVLTAVQAAGNGLFLASAPILLIRVAGLSPGQVGIGLSAAGLAGFAAAVPLGKLADRHGARRMLVAVYAALAVLLAAYPLVRDLAQFVAVAGLVSIAETAGSPLRSAVLRSFAGTAAAIRIRAQMRSGFNVGFLAGAAVAGVALTAPAAATFAAVAGAAALAHAGCAFVARTLPGASPVSDGRRPGPAALRDRRFLLLTAGNGLLELHTVVLTVGMPLWIVAHTGAPAGLNALLIILNTVVVLLLQVRLSRTAGTVAGSAVLVRRSGLLLAAGCTVCAAGSLGGAAVAAGGLLLGTAILAIGEIWQSAGAWGLSFELPPPDRLAEYQSVFGLGRAVGQFAGPALVTALLVGVGPPGWLVLAALFGLAGAGCAWLVRPAAVRFPAARDVAGG
ncbi:MFS transporter [Paractinoplanes rishiriensis]|uniref:MFS transporter n=1 Tax=Paractinoplanes rishiriensis TaxID=1050105 RepID=A0A919MTZ0_9ACTN|nr:MFS transporter [Actinoplanes rishiriensis]GIE99771.1 MFS transporter [Actinoplanes rishiriensis]